MKAIKVLIWWTGFIATWGVAIYQFAVGNFWPGFGAGLLACLIAFCFGIGKALVDFTDRHGGAEVLKRSHQEAREQGYKDGFEKGLKHVH